MAGLRNRVVHDYGHIDFEIIWEAVNDHLPLVCRDLSAFLRTKALERSRQLRAALFHPETGARRFRRFITPA
jgi:hypothetical protein